VLPVASSSEGALPPSSDRLLPSPNAWRNCYVSKMRCFATPPTHGALCNEIVHPARLCFKLQPPLTTEHGALCEPLSVAIYAVETKVGYVMLCYGTPSTHPPAPWRWGWWLS
jgi:hypothetical protein